MKQIKKGIVLTICIILIMSFAFSVNAYSPTLGWKYKLICKEYSGRVLNVYTEGTPTDGMSITLYTSNGGFSNTTQCWMFNYPYEYSGASYYIYKLALYFYPALVANYYQTNAACTLWSWDDDIYDDYLVSIIEDPDSGPFDIEIHLLLRSKHLGNSGDYNGAQCYWHSDGGTIGDEDIWTFYGESE